MNRNSSGRGPGRQRPVVPRFEVLEGREVPTVNFIVGDQTLFIVPSKTPSLTFTGERVTIIDNGGTGINNVIALGARPFIPNVAITDIVVLGSRQADHISYNLTGDLRGRRGLYVSMGAGDDTFDAFLRRNLTAGSLLQISAIGGAGNDRMTVTTVAQLSQNAVLDVFMEGGGGNDVLRSLTTSFVGVAAGARFDTVISGGAGNDAVLATYQGLMNGSAGLAVDLGGGDDKATAVYTLTRGSTGHMPPAPPNISAGNDDLTMEILNFGTGLTINNFLDGGTGTDVCTRTTNVIAVSCERDRIV